MDEITLGFCSILEENRNIMKQFKAATYKSSFEELCGSCHDLFSRIEDSFNKENGQEIVQELADAFVLKAKSDYDGKKKKDRSSIMIENNMILGTYLIPAIVHFKGNSSDPLADALLDKWNSTFNGYKLQKGCFEDIDSSFKRKLCYITTAVCENMGKADNCYELNTLRSYRDAYLAGTEEGRRLISDYYEMAPLIVTAISNRTDASDIYESIYREYLLPCLRDIETEEPESCKLKYIKMVEKLQQFCPY